MVLYDIDTDKMSSSVRRLNNLVRVFDYNSKIKPINDIILNHNCSLFCRHEHSGVKVTIGDIEKSLKLPKQLQYVPLHYLSKDLSQTTLAHLRWMMQKDNLKQDMFLIGGPGSHRRQLAMSYLELTQQEVEFVSLSRDTTEADLKQRREIINGSAKYINQSAVEAAIEGRVLILEGIEKAERNVLPVLNNLLENREMHLEDGRFLISPSNYDKLLKEFGKEHLDKWNLIRVSDDFRVIALGLPVPGYTGNPLDPPLRSRFQARDVSLPPFQEFAEELYDMHPEAPRAKLDQLLSCAYALHSPESKRLNLHDFPLDNLHYAAKILEYNPEANVHFVFCVLYPYSTVLTKEGKKALSDILRSFHIGVDNKQPYLTVTRKQPLNDEQMILYLNNNATLQVNVGAASSVFADNNSETNFISTTYHEHLLCELIHSHLVTDFCIVGPSGCGKSVLIRKFAKLMNYEVEPIVLYQDITSRDLIQQRTTLPNGDTVWKNCPLVDAALNGKLAILDGLHRVHSSTLAVLHRLVHDRELQLHDGKRLLRHDRYDVLASKIGIDKLQEIGVLRIHPSFRIVALAESPGNHIVSWLSPELLTLFLYHEMRRLTTKEELHLISSMFRRVDSRIKSIIEIAEKLRSSSDSSLVSVANSLSTRQILRISKRASIYPEFDIYDTIQRSCLAKFLPPLTKQALEKILNDAGLYPTDNYSSDQKKSILITDKTVQIGNTAVERYVTTASSKIPNTLFYDLPQHTDLLEQMLQDFSLGEHLLLVGNQGVGKNKLTDKLLQLLNRPREYIQLHRDTTVHSLTLQPTIVDGIVQYEDSALVKAISLGHVLIVDEADKAPTHVTCILKILVESGEMILSDGRRIMPPNNFSMLADKEPNRIIKMHPDFRMIVLANRPGFPFLGNNLFAALGDLFSCHIIDNPSPESEKKLLQSYGPDVPLAVIERIVSTFGELRNLSDKGMVSYPYSTREAVNIVKHLQTYPQDTLSDAVSNVFDFDRYSSEVRDILQKVLRSHEIPIDLIGMKRTKGRDLQMTIERDSGLDVSGPKHGKVDETGNPHVGGNTWAGGTGGRDTAGLGGKGGPYRLDAGHAVHQLSDAEKNAVPEHIQKAAREMGRKAFKERLREIEMSEYDAKLYAEFSSNIQKQVQALRVLLNNLQAKSKERQWVRHQTSGELDDMKLIEGITGERGIYRKRADVNPEIGAPQTKPKRLRLLVDVSGSMYRFNGHDGRLDREMEAAIMIMEAFYGHKSHISYDIVGHSGEDVNITFVPKHNPPSDNKQRLDVIKLMHAHSQFCWSGDNTLPAIRYSISHMEKEKNEFDEGVLIVLSDANLSRYGISPNQLADALQSSHVIRAYAIFIGSLGDQATRLKNSLPPGKGFVCMDLENIPQIIQQIFVSSLFNANN